MTLECLPFEFTVCQIEDVSDADLTAPFTFFSCTDEELSLVCPTDRVPARTINRVDHWRAFRIEGTLAFTMTGVLAGVASALAEDSIPIFAISTYNTDYILVKNESLAKAKHSLYNSGYTVKDLPLKTIRDYYDKTAADWAARWYEDDSMLPYLKEFVSLLPENPRVIDVGCGAGYESMRLSGLGADVVGIDISPVSIQIARERNPHLDFHVLDMTKNYSELGLFDGVAAIASLIHLPNERLCAAFERMTEVLKPGGLALISVRHGVGKQPKQSYVTIDGQSYDRGFYAHTLEELIEYSAGKLTFVQELLPNEDDIWKQYLFRKI